jgi:hypothetical protein
LIVFQANGVAVTTSRLPNRQTFTERPEFCALLQKLRKKCASEWKKEELDYQYPDLCSLIREMEGREEGIMKKSSVLTYV